MRRKKRGRSLALWFAAVVISAAAPGAFAQQEGFSSLYGSRNLQYVSLRYSPSFTPLEGQGGELLFGFNTLSAKTNTTRYKYFYGVALGGGGASWPEADLGKYGHRDASNGYILFLLENRLFATGDGSVRPFVGSSVGYGSGAFWSEDVKGKDDPDGGMDFFTAGVEVGIHFVAANDYAVTLAGGMEARSVRYGSEMKGVYPVMITVGICRWRGPLP